MLKKNSYSVILDFPKGDAKATYNSHIHYSIQIKNNRKVSILVNMNYDLILPRLFQNKLGYIDSNKIRLINIIFCSQKLLCSFKMNKVILMNNI